MAQKNSDRLAVKIFNTTGPVRAADHYILDPISRWDTDEIDFLIQQKKYFVLHAPRQSGKTTSMLALQERLNREGQFYCLYVNVEPAQVAKADDQAGIETIIELMINRAQNVLNDKKIQGIARQIMKGSGEGTRSKSKAWLSLLLSKWCTSLNKPLVLLIDEIDSLIDDTLLSTLRQLREGYDTRPEHFPQSVILCGVRDVRDYRINSTAQNQIVTGGSAFNIKAESLTLGNFSLEQIKTLYLQHTHETGQVFCDEIWDTLWQYTCGQPWLVNALAYELCFKIPETKIRSTDINLEYLKIAKERLIQRRDTHLDQLIDKLKENRVRRVIEPLLSGKTEISEGTEDDIQYCKDLGLIARDLKNIQIANQIYKEVIPRTLTHQSEQKILEDQTWYIDPISKRLDFLKLIKSFQEFFRRNIEHWIKDFNYPEAGPQLLLQAFLQRIINGGGRIEREYGLGRGRVDLHIEWPLEENAYQNKGPIQEVVIECKVLRAHDGLDTLIAKGLEQTYEYGDRIHKGIESHLIIFDRDSTKNWDEKIWMSEQIYKDKPIFVWGM